MRILTTRLLVPAVLAASALATVAVPAATAGHASPPARSTTPHMRVGTYNFEAFKPMKAFVPAMKKFKKQVDVAGLQEMGMTSRAKWLLKDHSRGYFPPPPPPEDPIIRGRLAVGLVNAKGIKI